VTHGLVQVEWIDSLMLDHGEWMDVSDTEEAMTADSMKHHTVGFIIREVEDAIAVASSVNEDGNRACGVVVIPKSAIRSRKELHG
jgi:hypothetical protein